ncbi:replicative DNA helicase [Corynebacterium sp. TAE3-ERU2]|nr:replicative DNA helicase [Corynebacterium sp. TAE3-ERU2]
MATAKELRDVAGSANFDDNAFPPDPAEGGGGQDASYSPSPDRPEGFPAEAISDFPPAPEFAPSSFDDSAPSYNHAGPNQGRFAPQRSAGRGRVDDATPRDYARQLPHDREAEQGVLGAMLIAPTVVTDIVEELNPEDFYAPQHQLIYRAILDLYADNKQIDTFIVRDRLHRHGDLERAGGPSYLVTLAEVVPTPANAPYYAEIVSEKAVLRRLVSAGTRIVQLGYEAAGDTEIEVMIDLAQQEVFQIAQKKTVTDYAVLDDLLQPVMDELDEIAQNGGLSTGVPTGFIDLDRITNGLHAGQMIIVAARPGVGKSTIALDFMRSCSIKHNMASVLFSLEMSKSEIVMRLLSAEAEVKLSDMRSGTMSDDDWARIAQRAGELSEAPLFIDDSPNLTMMEIRSKARQLKDKHDLQLIVVDYLQLMSSGKKVESRQQEVSEFSRQLKLLAKELEVPLVAVAQLNRGPESRTDKRPQLADLRESGSLEQDADMVMLLYRPDSQDLEDVRAGEADIILAKHRGGPIGTVEVAHQLHYSRFKDLARA